MRKKYCDHCGVPRKLMIQATLHEAMMDDEVQGYTTTKFKLLCVNCLLRGFGIDFKHMESKAHRTAIDKELMASIKE